MTQIEKYLEEVNVGHPGLHSAKNWSDSESRIRHETIKWEE